MCEADKTLSFHFLSFKAWYVLENLGKIRLLKMSHSTSFFLGART